MDKIAKKIKERKIEHIEICLKEKVSHKINYWDLVHLIHNALPELKKEDVKTEVNLFGKKLSYPIIIAAMGGGKEYNKNLNLTCAKVAEELQIGFCVGSQRIALVDKELVNSFKIVKEFDIPLKFANIGATQLVRQKEKEKLSLEDVYKLMEMIDADVLTIFLNPSQELIQPEGDENFEGILSKIEELSKNFLVNVKEIGCGISKEVATALKNAGVKGIEVAGISGTSWIAVEHFRAKKAGVKIKEELGELFWNWGIPSPISVLECRKVCNDINLIGSGGIRNGLDVAKAIALGADAASIARILLKPALLGVKELKEKLETVIAAFKTAMILTGAKDIEELKKTQYILLGELKEWEEQRLK